VKDHGPHTLIGKHLEEKVMRFVSVDDMAIGDTGLDGIND